MWLILLKDLMNLKVFNCIIYENRYKKREYPFKAWHILCSSYTNILQTVLRFRGISELASEKNGAY